MFNRVTLLVVASALVLSSDVAHAQATPAPDRTPPSWRLDVLLGVGGGWFTEADNEGLMAVSAELRLMGRAGHGAMIRGDLLASFSSDYGLIEMGYVHRWRFEGDDVRGTSFDFSAGLVGGQASIGSTGKGYRFGTGVGGSIDWRFYPFTIGLGIRVRVVAGGPQLEGVFGALLTFGFGFWGG